MGIKRNAFQFQEFKGGFVRTAPGIITKAEAIKTKPKNNPIISAFHET